MGSLNQWIENHLLVITILFIVITCLNFALVITVIQKLKKYRTLLRGNEGKDLETVLLGLSDKIASTASDTHNLLADLANQKIKAAQHFQNWSLIRFKAFENTGGDQSFALALLDEMGNGFVISSIFGREESRVYCKSVQAGVSNYPLSQEEKEAIQKALGTNKNKSC